MGSAVTPPIQAADFRGEQDRAGWARSRGVEPRRHLSSSKPVETAPKGNVDPRKEETSEGLNPRSVTGMKQGRTVPGGSNRQEGAKP